MQPILKIILAAAFFSAGLSAQLRFETASIAKSRSEGIGYAFKMEGKAGQPVTLSMRNVSLKYCIQQAYSVKEYQVAGPGWIRSARYDIEGTLPPGNSREQLRAALQTLLAERLKVRLRRETREMPIYTLVVTEKGPRLRPAAGGGKAMRFQPGARNQAKGAATIRQENISIREFCGDLSRNVKRPVVDKTGVSGTFDFDLKYSKRGDESAPSIFTALEQQLGLRLEPAKGDVESLIVESAVRKP
jgi:uncharacterized protein (TIGR03435 family)